MVTWHVTRLRCCPVIVWTFNSRTDCAALWTCRGAVPNAASSILPCKRSAALMARLAIQRAGRHPVQRPAQAFSRSH
jgi:hypothetical protein